jgi:hypothetical protein
MSSDGNQFEVLATPQDDQKSWDAKSRKDDTKQQAFNAREGLKAKAVQLQEKVVDSGILDSVTSTVQSGIQMAKGKLAAVTGDSSIQNKSNEELVDDASEVAGEQWETVKRKGKNQLKKASDNLNTAVEENLNANQKRQLNKGIKSAKQGAAKLDRQAKGFMAPLLNMPALKGVRGFIMRNNLQLPIMILGGLITLWTGLSIIRLITTSRTHAPEFDIHSKDATMSWLKYHAGEYKDKAWDTQQSLTGKAAAFLANHEFDKFKNNVIDWQEIGMKKLGLQAPTMTERVWGRLTGRPVTWQSKVESVLQDAKDGINKVDFLHRVSNVPGSVKDVLGLHEPTFTEKLRYYMTGHTLPTVSEQLAANAKLQASGAYDSIKSSIPGFRSAPVAPGIVDSLRQNIVDGMETVRSHIPGTSDYELAKQRAYDLAHPSTLDNIKSTAEYVKNRIVHGSQEAAHIAQDRANELTDKAKYKTGL